MEKQFVVLYTHQKQKKAKTWHDGTLKHSGSGTKAVLYDEKGCRLDSIHIKVDDIKLGEQLESDRYYILVEEIKIENSAQQVPGSSTQPEPSQAPLTSHTSFSRARCAGLKRKKSGFMPPRMVKQAHVENAQDDNYGNIGFLQSGLSDSSYQNKNTRRVPLSPHQTQNPGNNVTVTEKFQENENYFQKYPAESIGRNLYNLYSRYNKQGNDSGSEKSSQESSFSGENKRLLSPWSVYGSKNSSPSLNVGMIRNEVISKSPQPGLATSVSSKSEGADEKFDGFIGKPNEKSDIPDYRRSEKTKSWSAVSSQSVLQQDTTEIFSTARIPPGKAFLKQEEQLNESSSELINQSKRNITQIMKLLKKKPLPDDNFPDSFTNSVKNDKSWVLNKSISKSSNAEVSISLGESTGTCIEKVMLEGSGTRSKETPDTDKFRNECHEVEAVGDKGKLSDERVTDSDLRSNKENITKQAPTKENLSLLETFEESDDEDLIGSFHINFSPLSHVTDSDDEKEVTSSNGKDITASKSDCNSFHTEKYMGETAINEGGSVAISSNTSETSKVIGSKHFQNLIECKSDTSQEFPSLIAKESMPHLKNCSRRIDNTNNPPRTNITDHLESSEVDVLKMRCGSPRFESKKDVLHDIDREFSETNELFDDEKLDVATARRTDENHCSPDQLCVVGNNEEAHLNNSGETDFVKVCHIRSDISNIDDCNNDTKDEVDTSKTGGKESEVQCLLDNKVASVDASKQLVDKNDVGGTFKTADNETDMTGDSSNQVATVVGTKQAADNNESQYSNTTSLSQDTMEFSCATFGDDSQNYFGIQTQQLGRLVPSTFISNNSEAEDKSDIYDARCFKHKMHDSKTIENSNSYAINSVNKGDQYEHESMFETTAARSPDVDKNPTVPNPQSSGYQMLQQRKASMDMIHLTAPALCSDFEDVDTEDPLGNIHDIPGTVPPHPNILLQRHAREKAQMRKNSGESQEFSQPNHGVHSIDTQLGSYGTQGVTSAVVARVHHNHIDGRTAYQTGSQSPALDQVYNQHQSPFQQLSDSDLSRQSSPSFYIDWQNNKPQIHKADKVSEDESGTVFCHDYDVTHGGQQSSMERPASRNTDEEEIYSKLYKPRLMYKPDDQNQSKYIECVHSNTCQSSRESSPASMPETHKLTQFNRRSTHAEETHDSLSNSFESLPNQNLQAFNTVPRACAHSIRQPYLTESTNYHAQFSQSSEEYFLQVQTKSSVSSIEPGRERIRTETDEDAFKTTESSGESRSVNSKWHNFVASQNSDDCDIDMDKLSKRVENTRKIRKDFVALKSSPGLYNTQRVFYQNAVHTEKDQTSILHLQSLNNGLDSQKSDIDNVNSLSNGDVDYSSLGSMQLSESKPNEFIQNNKNTETNSQKNKIERGKDVDGRINVSGTVKPKQTDNLDSDIFSSLDSFENLLADDDFEIEELKENVRSRTSETKLAEQQVPEIDITDVDVAKVTDEDNKMKKNTDISVSDKNEISVDKYEDSEAKENAYIENNATMNVGNCMRQKTNVKNEALVPAENVLSPEMENAFLDSGESDQKLEHSRKTNEVSEAGVEYLKQTDTRQKICNDFHSLKENEDSIPRDKSPLFMSESMSDSLEYVGNKDIDIKKGENENNFPGFSLDESLDLSFSLDSNSVCSSQPDRCNRKTPSMRIGWRPPVKLGSQINHGQSTNKTETMSQQKETKSLEKLKPTFKCLRLITQNKAKTDSENGKNTNNENSKDSKTVSPYSERESGSGSEQKWKFKSPKPSPDLRYVKQYNPWEKNVLQGLGRENDVETTKNEICQQKRLQGGQSPSIAPNKRFKPPSLTRTAVVNRTISSPILPHRHHVDRIIPDLQGSGVSQIEFRFPSRSETERMQNVLRQVIIPDTFPSSAVYKQVLTAALTEYVNTQLFDVAKRYHHALSKVDTSGYSEYKSKNSRGVVNNPNPQCQCGVPSKMVCVKKEGANCGRYFYACSANRKQQCKFFQWADEMRKGAVTSGNKRKIQDTQSLRMYMKDQRVHFYGECQLIKRTKENINKYFKAPKWARNRGDGDMIQKKQIFLKLPYKGRSSMYAKDDIWVISKHLDFDPLQSFLARSTYYGPSSSLEVEIEPLIGYSPSNWQHETVCHAILAGNVSTELSCLDNIREHIQTQSPLVLPHLLNRQSVDTELVRNSTKGFQAPRVVGDQGNQSGRNVHLHSEQMDNLSREYIERYRLNTDQAEALKRVANMFSIEKSFVVDSILLIHGVFGAGKSFLLSVMVLFLVEVFQLNDSQSPGQPFPWKLLISSTTNVAVDRILIGLLDLGFEDFVRVGSVKKIAKPVLPFSVHASGTDNQELKDLQEMLRSGELTATEKSHVRQSIEKHRLGENKKKLGRVRVVGATCASCSLTCLNNMQFPLVLLDECSQMTEPASLLPIARFGCQKLLLVGDPKQLDPTIQGAEAAHQNGLEQTLFDRLIKMGSVPTLLRTQYRCHPNISAVANKLFYGGMLEDGVSDWERKPLLEILPTICYFDVERGEECCEAAGSYYNEREAQFVVFLLQVLLSSGIEPSALGVITLYKSQMARISDLLTGQGNCMDMKGVQVSTVDAFQGGERDVIILSTVRSQACGFIDNDKRTNVALTRAKHHLLIVGNMNNLSKNVLWGKVINHCKCYENGIQSADEARHSLEKYLEKLKTCETSQESQSNKPANSQNSTASEKATRKRKARRKRKLSESEIDSEVSSCQTNEQSLNSSIDSRRRSKKRTKKDMTQAPDHMIEDIIDNDDFDDDFIVDGLDTNIPGEGIVNSMHISPSGNDQLSAQTIDNCESNKQHRKRHEDRLNTLQIDSDPENTDDEDLPTFNCD